MTFVTFGITTLCYEDKCHYAGCCYVKCRYAQCHGAQLSSNNDVTEYFLSLPILIVHECPTSLFLYSGFFPFFLRFF
jgi:hypothetical protein